VSKRATTWIAGAIAVALLALLVYSIDRSAWLMALYETGQPHAYEFGLAAAIVIELVAVALIAGEGAADLFEDKAMQAALRFWSGIGLLVVVSVQVVANFVAGWLRGGTVLLAMLGTGDGWARFAIAAVAWLVANMAAPVLLFVLSKIAAVFVKQLISMPADVPTESAPIPALVLARVDELPPQPTYAAPVRSDWVCPGCGRILPDQKKFAAARRWKRCDACKPE
jgi:hypothetical protein